MMRTSPRRRSLRLFESLEGRMLLAAVVPDVPPPPPVVVGPISPSPSIGPAVAAVQFEPLTGRVLVQYTADPTGYDPATLTNPANYSFSLDHSFVQPPSKNPSRPSAGVVLSPTYQVTGVTLTSPIEPGVAPSVIVSINNNQPLKFGIFQFTIHASGLMDEAGQPLEGHYSGTFPTGDGLANLPGGSDFSAVLAEVNSTVLPALPLPSPVPSQANPSGVAPSYVFLPTTRGVQVHYTSATKGEFVLAGGNNITLKAKSFQYFPGTYRLLKLDATLIPGARHSGLKG